MRGFHEHPVHMTEGKVFLSSDIPLSHEGQTLLFLAFCYALVALGAILATLLNRLPV